MSEIDNGIKQPLRFYDSVTKQNWRQKHVNDGGLRFSVNDNNTGVSIVLINPINTIVPFQLRRRRSPNPVTVFDLYSWDGSDFSLDIDLFTITPAPTTNHLRIVQMQYADNIVWFPTAEFTSPISCGAHYIHISDGSNNWYSEVFVADGDLEAENTTYVTDFSDPVAVNIDRLIQSAGNYLVKDNKPF
jgi:hypothetical protein